ncbi:hypothetical protein RCL1_006397 [Eukaryota sp. TZLM3-RCL]
MRTCVAKCSVFSPARNKHTENVLERRLSKQLLYKTEWCRLLLEKGHCPWGTHCNFAHSADELKAKLCHPLFKTEKCKAFHEQGYCPYGSRCRFDHSLKSEDSAHSCNIVPSLCIKTASSLVVIPDPQTPDQVESLTCNNVKKSLNRLPCFSAFCNLVQSSCAVI